MIRDAGDLKRRPFLVAMLAVLAVAALLRGIFPAADPPWRTTVGVVWHDEGAWVHNARNKALFGAWSLDAWNPMYIAPVFTGLEYVAFTTCGVGVRQARLVPECAGLVSVLLLALGVARIGGRRAGLVAGILLASNYVYVMWNRAAEMEGPMTAFMVASWYCSVRSTSNPRWGLGAGLCALLALFTKASAAFFVAAVGLDAVMVLAPLFQADTTTGLAATRRAAWLTLAGLALGSAVALGVFVLPHWTDYRFYNWQMSVTRKPSYDLKSLVDRVSWFPILHDLFTRMWAVLFVAATTAFGLLARWRRLSAGERLLLLWIALGAIELTVHDVGNERRFVFFIPALVALAAIALGRERVLVAPEAASLPRRRALLALPLVLFASYVVIGAILRLSFLYEISPNVRLAAAGAVLFTTGLYVTWPRIPRAWSRGGWSPAAGLAVALLLAGGQVAQFVQWAAGHTYRNYDASRAIGRALPPGTLVHGKLANGLSLENRIRPVFVGRGFGNYEDRKTRGDVRYILTYVSPSLGYESQKEHPVINDVLDAYPAHRIIMTFDVAETASGQDRAALIDKFGATDQHGPQITTDRHGTTRIMSGRAHD